MTSLWLVGTAVTVALAEICSEVVGTETSRRLRVTHSDLAHKLDDALAVAFGVSLPAVFFLLAAVGLLDHETAFGVAKWTGLGLIGFYGFWAARSRGRPHVLVPAHCGRP